MTQQEIEEALAAPFDAKEVKFRPGSVSGNRALALAYVDARVIQDRLDSVLGVSGWQDEYTPVEGGNYLCKLTCKLGDEWVTKMDIGGESEQPDGGDRAKSAVSDALKRAAVKFGIGRYLYRFPKQWADYDPQKRQFVKPPAVAVQPDKHDQGKEVLRKLLEGGLALLTPAAAKGHAALQAAWEKLDTEVKQACHFKLDELKKTATEAGNKKAVKHATPS